MNVFLFNSTTFIFQISKGHKAGTKPGPVQKTGSLLKTSFLDLGVFKGINQIIT